MHFVHLCIKCYNIDLLLSTHFFVCDNQNSRFSSVQKPLLYLEQVTFVPPRHVFVCPRPHSSKTSRYSKEFENNLSDCLSLRGGLCTFPPWNKGTSSKRERGAFQNKPILCLFARCTCFPGNVDPDECKKVLGVARHAFWCRRLCNNWDVLVECHPPVEKGCHAILNGRRKKKSRGGSAPNAFQVEMAVC
ncbi:hypothetical protein CDAR_581971 [Caerostris darwini]|uniref:Uncharacterized protein n=1 Tax=Caerostris darwini TaxID=1538125 RepID=A0AAV4X6M6_9ARAC|nr:hypothetical protein CDAR_581971 [Caerostris darwini]